MSRAKFEEHRDDRPNGPRGRLPHFNQASLPSERVPRGQEAFVIFVLSVKGKVESSHKPGVLVVSP